MAFIVRRHGHDGTELGERPEVVELHTLSLKLKQPEPLY
jgi:hypothetical protein